MDNFHNYHKSLMKNKSVNKPNLKNLLHNLKLLQPSILKLIGSPQVSITISSKLYLIWLKKVVSLLEIGISSNEPDVLKNKMIQSKIPIKTEGRLAKPKQSTRRVHFQSHVTKYKNASDQQVLDNGITTGNIIICGMPLNYDSTLSPITCKETNYKSLTTFIWQEGKMNNTSKNHLIPAIESSSISVPPVDNVCISNTLLSDPMWSSGSLKNLSSESTPQTDRSKVHHLSFSPQQNMLLKTNILSPGEVELIKKEYLKCTDETSLIENFKSPKFSYIQSNMLRQKVSNEEKVNSELTDNITSSPWKKSFDPDMTLSPYWKFL